MHDTNSILRGIFTEAAEISDPAARAAFLESACKGDKAFKQRVEQLLNADSEAGNFLSDQGNLGSPSERLGQRIGRYRLVEMIGKGGCGVVYLAEQQEPVRRQLALKVIRLGMDTGTVVARFEAERQALALMDHPNIAKVFDAGATETGRPFFVMELVRGLPITAYCEQNGLTVRQRLEVFIQVCHAVQHAHQKGIIHRDLKPSNILVTEQDGVAVPKVIDFGVAKATDQQLDTHTVTRADQFIGTPAYMSPEQVDFGTHDIDTRSDIYSLGVVLHELMAGQPPFSSKELLASGLDEMRRKIREVDPLKPSTVIARRPGAAGWPSPVMRERFLAVRGDIDSIVLKCLEKDRTRRYPTANGLATDIRRHLENEPITARPPTGFYRFQKIVRRNRLAFSAATAITLVLILAVIVSTRLAYRAIQAEHEQSRLRGLAEAKATESRQRLVRKNVADGNRVAEAGDALSALPWFVEALEMEIGDPLREADERLRINTALQHSPQLSQMIFHGRWINCIAFSPDGKRLVTGANEYMACVWDVSTGKLLLQLPRQRQQVRAAQFSPDGGRLVTIDHAGIACIWNSVTGERLSPWLRGADYDGALMGSLLYRLNPIGCFSPDGKLVLTVWSGKSATVWDGTNGALRHSLTHTQVVYHATFSPDGRYIVTSGLDQLATIWDAQTGQPVVAPLRHSKPVAWCQFSPDGQRLLTLSERRRVQVWDWRSGQRIGAEMLHDAVLFHASFSPDGQQILTAGWDMVARIWSAISGQLVAQFEHPGGLVGAAFAPSGDRIATACHDGIARVWEIGAGRQKYLSLPNGSEADIVSFSPDGRSLAVGGRGGAVRIWNLAPDDRMTWTFPGRDIVWAEFSRDGSKLVTAGGGLEQGARIWDGKTGEAITPWLSHPFAVRKATFSADASRLLTIGEGRTAHFWDANKGQELIPALGHSKRVYDAALSADGKRIATACDDRAGYVWDATTGHLLAKLPHSNSVTAIAFSPDGRLVATGGRDKVARIWRTESGQMVLPALRQPAVVRQLCFSPDGSRLATACYFQGATHGMAQLWDVATGKALGEPMRHRDDLRAVEFSPDGRYVVTTANDRIARVWDATTGNPISPPLSHRDSVVHAVFFSNGRRLATLAGSGEVRLWNTFTGEPITMSIQHSHRHEAGRLSFSPDESRLLIATGADVAYARRFTPDSSSLRDLMLRGQVLSGRQIHDSAGSVVLESLSLSNAWHELRADR